MSCAAKKRLVVQILNNLGTKTVHIGAYVGVKIVLLVRGSMNILNVQKRRTRNACFGATLDSLKCVVAALHMPAMTRISFV